VLVDSSNLPATADPDITILVGTADLDDILESDKLSDKTLPEIKTVLGGLKLGVDDGDAVHVVGNTKDAAHIKRGEVRSRGREGVNAKNERLHSVVG
jgi:hypothetical protein